MTESSDAAETKPAPTSLSPFLQRALSRLQHIASGNGVDPAAITLTGQDEASYTIAAQLRLSPEWDVRPASAKAARNAKVTLLKTEAEMEQLGRAPFPSLWLNEAQQDLQPLPGHGWGLDGKHVSLPQHDNIYGLEQQCATCRGAGTTPCEACHGRGHLTCQTCHGAGEDPQHHGKPCPTCNARNQIACTQCRQGKANCKACAGKGKKMRLTERRLLVATKFEWVGGADLPTELRRAIDRAGLTRLASGHADIAQTDTEELNGNHGLIKYTATLPFSIINTVVDGKTHRAMVLGKKGAILEMPPFLDPIVEKALAADEAAKLRLFGDAQRIAAQRQPSSALLQEYPVGLSAAVAAKVHHRARRALHTMTRIERQATLAVGTLLGCGAIYEYFTYWRHSLAVLRVPQTVWDALLPIVLVALIAVLAGRVECFKLRKNLGVSRPRSEWKRMDLIPVMLVILLAYGAYLLYGPNPPRWYTDIALDRDIARHSVGLDPPLR